MTDTKLYPNFSHADECVHCVYLSLCIVDIIICALSIVYFQYFVFCSRHLSLSKVFSMLFITVVSFETINAINVNQPKKKEDKIRSENQTCKSTRLSGRFGQENACTICIVCFECLFIIFVPSFHSLLRSFFCSCFFFFSFDYCEYNKIKSS